MEIVAIALKLGLSSGPFGGGGNSYAGLIFAIVMAALAVDLVDLLVYGSVPRFSAIRGFSQFGESGMSPARLNHSAAFV